MISGTVEIKSPAKLNLFLEVTGRRADGFHELETVMVRTDFHDLISARIRSSDDSEKARLVIKGSPQLIARLPADSSNLIVQAAKSFQRKVRQDLDWQIVLTKNIPMEAGLAGGSSNAASTLLALNELTGQPLSKAELHEIAASLGSDINFFIEECESAVCTGRGEIVTPIPSEGQLFFVIARPAAGNSTPEVFQRLVASSETVSSSALTAGLAAGNFADIQKGLFNRLTIPASELNLEMQELLHSLSAVSGRQAVMSGSGSTCFVCCRNQPEAEAILDQVRQLQPAFCQLVRMA